MNSEQYCSFIPQRRLQMFSRVSWASVAYDTQFTPAPLCPARASVSSEAVAVNLSGYESKWKESRAFFLPHHLFTAAEAAQIQDSYRSMTTAAHPSPAPKAFFHATLHLRLRPQVCLQGHCMYFTFISFCRRFRQTAAIRPQMCLSHFSSYAPDNIPHKTLFSNIKISPAFVLFNLTCILHLHACVYPKCLTLHSRYCVF